ncbi:MAG: COQ9 family protein [Pseudomonadota bacterium]
MPDKTRELIDALLDAALPHVVFDGWSDTTFQAAIADAGVDPALARAICPRGSVDLARAFHARGDGFMLDRLADSDLAGMRLRDKIACAVRFRLEAVEDKDVVRRGVTLFSLPSHAAEGAQAIWGTCDLIWTALGDTSDDVNWYTKRATLSAVYSATLLFWLGDGSAGHQASWAFLDRRIDDVMRFESFKAQVRKNPLFKPLLAGPDWLASQIRPPARRDDLPGTMTPRQ